MCDVKVFASARAADEKTEGLTARELGQQRDLMLRIATGLGYRYQDGHRVLDFGCGIGEVVHSLLDHGYDAYGVDVGEWWGKDHAAYWHASSIPEPRVCDRLSTASSNPYRLPYPDHCFDLIISSQVFEHVFNYVEVFAELKRVMKPHAVSVHVFPGPGTPFEPHLGIPVTPLAKNDAWLRLWSLVSRRHRAGWNEEFRYLVEHMRSNNYPTKRQLLRHAAVAGVVLDFREDLYIDAARRRPWRILQTAKRWGLARLAFPIVGSMCQRTMVIRPT